jgi:hypothetical protein
MRYLNPRRFRILLIAIVLFSAAAVTEEVGRADPASCFLQYTWETQNCGTPQECAPEDWLCQANNARIGECYDAAANHFFECMGYGN